MHWRKQLFAILVCGLFLSSMLLSLAVPGAAAAASPQVYINGQLVSFPDVQPVIVNGRTMVPVRFIAEHSAFGATVTFEEKTRRVTIQGKDRTIELWPYSCRVNVNGSPSYLEVAPFLWGGRTLVPLRFISETLGAAVDWDPWHARVTITTGQQSDPKWTVLGYYYVDAYDQLVAQADRLTDVAFHWYTTDAWGNLRQVPEIPYNYRQALEYARQRQLRTQPSIALFDQQQLHTLLNSQEARHHLIDQILELVHSQQYQAVNLDFEQVAPADGEAYNTFLAELSGVLRTEGIGLLVAVPAKDREVSWNAAYDYARIAGYADKLVIMAYDYHWRYSEPGPIAPLDWVQRVVAYAKQRVPAGQLLLGLGIYGYDWPAGGVGATALSYPEAQALAAGHGVQPLWDAVAYLPHFGYNDSNWVWHEVWYEDPVSLKAKLDLAAREGLGGISIWQLGFGFPEFWAELTPVK